MTDVPARPGECARCQAYALATPNLIDACADEAQARGLQIAPILAEIMRRYHDAGHVLVSTS